MTTFHRRVSYANGDYGMGNARVSRVEGEVTTNLLGRLEAVFRSPEYEPPMLPSIALDLHALTHRPEVSFSDVEEVLRRDPVLAAKVLRLANSAGRAGWAVDSLHGALARVGLTGLRDIVWQVALQARVFRCDHFAPAMEAVRVHSIQVAHLTRLVCLRTAIPIEYGFLCGLLHDVGTAACFLVLAEMGGATDLDDMLVGPAIETAHTQASGMLARMWKLPPDLVCVLESHHGGAQGGHVHPLSAAVTLAEALWANHNTLMLGDYALDPLSPRRAQQARLTIGLTDAQWGVLEREGEALISTLTG